MQRTPAGVLHYRWNALGYTRSRSGRVMAALGRKLTLTPGLAADQRTEASVGPARLCLCLLGKFERIFNLDPEVAHRALQLGVSQEELDSPQVFRSVVDQRRFGAAQ